MKEKKQIRAPHVFVLILIMIVCATVLTYVLPAGTYNRYVDEATGTTLVEDGSYQQIEQTPVSIFGMLQAIPDGLIDAASIVSMVLVYGGAFGIINTTRVIEYGIASSIEKMRRFSALIIPVIMILFSLMGSMLGVSESCYAFIPLCIMLAKAMGYDAIVGFAMVMLANMMGFTAGPMNMYTTGIAQQIAELPLFSGIGVRLLVYVVLMALAIGYVLWYGARIKKDPTRSLMYNVAVAEEESIESKYSAAGFTARKKLTMAVLLLGFCGLIFGIVGLGWWEGSTIGGYLLGMSIVVAAVDGKKPNEMAQGFTDGAKGVLMGALMVGFARAIILILTEGNVIDTVLYYASLLINKTSSSVAAAVIYVFTFFFNFLVPSGSGKAAIVMPLLVPMADMADIGCPGLPAGRWPHKSVLADGCHGSVGYGQRALQQVVQVVSAPDPCDFRGIHHHCRHLCPGGLRPVLRQERSSHELSGDQAAGRGKLRFRGSDPQKIPRASGTEQPGA